MTIDPTTEYEPAHDASATGHLLDELQLYGHRSFGDDPDPRPLPEARIVQGAIADIFYAMVCIFEDSRLEPDLDDILWSTVNIFHRMADRIERALDNNEQAQKRSQREQDGSEVKSVELERLLAEGLTLVERRNAFEFMRDQAADRFEDCLRSPWRPRSGSMVNRKALTSAMIDSRDFLNARRRAENEVLLPGGPKVAFTGGYEVQDHRAVWAALDRVHAKHPGMVLIHGGSPKGAEHIASLWARHHHRWPEVIWRRAQGDRSRRPAADGGVEKQSGGEQPPAVSTTRKGDEPLPQDEDPAEVQFGSRLSPKPFQPGAPPRQPRNLQTKTLRRIG